jgi:hypothetical protein
MRKPKWFYRGRGCLTDITTNISVDMYKLLKGNIRKYDGKGKRDSSREI